MQLSAISLALTRIYGGGAWSPSSLFANSEVGAWYDPSDLSTMFQDSAGMTQVTADGQPVGLILDKSKGLVLGPELVLNGDFSNGTAGWTSGATATPSVTGGVLTITNLGSGVRGVGRSFTTVVGKTYKVSVDWVPGTADTAYIGIDTKNIAWGTALFNLTSLGIGNKGGVFTATGTTTYISLLQNGALGVTTDFDNVSVKELPGNHASQATAASRPLYKTDGTYHWLQFDGVDDSLSTAAIDFTSTGEMFVCAGSVSAPYVDQSNFLELGPTYDSTFPSFLIRGCHTATNYLFCSLHDSTGYYITNPQPINLGNVKTVQSRQINPSGLTVFDKFPVSRVNAVEYQTPNSTTVADGGSYVNAPLNIGRRNNASEPFTGNIYSLIVRGALSTTQEITDTETWVNSKCGAF